MKYIYIYIFHKYFIYFSYISLNPKFVSFFWTFYWSTTKLNPLFEPQGLTVPILLILTRYKG